MMIQTTVPVPVSFSRCEREEQDLQLLPRGARPGDQYPGPGQHLPRAPRDGGPEHCPHSHRPAAAQCAACLRHQAAQVHDPLAPAGGPLGESAQGGEDCSGGKVHTARGCLCQCY